jgi:hypothetical protein
MRRFRRRALVAAVIASATVFGAIATATSTPVAAQEPAAPTFAELQVQYWCVDTVDDTANARQRTLRQDQCDIAKRQRADELATPSPSGSSSPTASSPATPTATTPPTTTVAPTTVPPTTQPPAPGDPLFCAPFPAFPDEHCTGWKHTGVTLHACGDPAGSATHLQVANATYDGCLFADSVVIQAANITIRRSWIKGVVRNQMRTADDKPDYRGAQLIDVEVGPSGDPDFAGISNGSSFSCLRCHVHNTASGMHIGDNNSLIDSYLHTFLDTGSHGAAAGTGQGMGDHSVVAHNNLECSRDSGLAHCSSALSLYDEPTLDDVLVYRNLLNSVSGYGMYGGGPQGTNIRVIENTFGQKFYPTCGLYGPVAAFYAGNAGNQWSGNKYENGQVVNPSSNT